MNETLILASASPRRRAILESMGVAFEVVIPDVTEVCHADDPNRTVCDSALLKHSWCRARYPDRRILTADTIVVFEGKPLIKPESMDQAWAFFRSFSGRKQSVLTAVAYSRAARPVDLRVVESTVVFKPLDDATVRRYFEIVDPMDKAGAYDIGQEPDLIIAAYEGSRTNIMGLPRDVAASMLEERDGGQGD